MLNNVVMFYISFERWCQKMISGRIAFCSIDIQEIHSNQIPSLYCNRKNFVDISFIFLTVIYHPIVQCSCRKILTDGSISIYRINQTSTLD